jgi:hypothetical protein
MIAPSNLSDGEIEKLQIGFELDTPIIAVTVF